MPLENTFATTAQGLDTAIVAGMNDAVASGIAWITPQIGAALALYVVGYGVATLYGKVDTSVAMAAVVRTMVITAILKAENYNYYVRDLFFTDLPNSIAAALHGARVTINSAQQFDVMWDSVVHYESFMLKQATSWFMFGDRIDIGMTAELINLTLWACFGVWYISRAFMALIICLGPFLIVLYLWRSTRGYVEQWIGKLVGLTMLGLSSAILLRIVMVIMNNNLARIEFDPNRDLTGMENNFHGILGVFIVCAVLMMVIPSVISIGSGVGAGAAVASGMLMGAAARAAGLAGSVAGAAGRLGSKAAGRLTRR